MVCASLSDIFDNHASPQWRRDAFDVMVHTPHLDWLLLTKRPERILQCVPATWLVVPPTNVWYGTSVESKDYVQRVRELRKVPAAVRFLLVEPLLGPIPRLPLVGIDWVILGGESGGRLAAGQHGVAQGQCLKGV